jgi:hypothetical protein
MRREICTASGFPFPPGMKSRRGGSSKERRFYRVRFDTADGRIAVSPGALQKRKKKEGKT